MMKIVDIITLCDGAMECPETGKLVRTGDPYETLAGLNRICNEHEHRQVVTGEPVHRHSADVPCEKVRW